MNLLRITLHGEEAPYYTIKRAFQTKFEVDDIYWQDYSYEDLQKCVISKINSKNYDACFMQIQKGGVLSVSTAQLMSSKFPVFNWTGDVRSDISFFYDIAPYVVTLFTNTTDVDKMKDLGYKSDFLQVGYDDMYYYNRDVSRSKKVVFCGNNYSQIPYPLTKDRYDLVVSLKKYFGENFVLYGDGWDNLSSGKANNRVEAELYNTNLIAINFSHFDYGRYHSDRLLREMACGSLVLSHRYKSITTDYKEGEHLVTFDSISNLIELCKHYFDNVSKAIEIGKQGSEYVSKNCKWVNRVQEFCHLLKKYGHD